jgi:hypothetical protein
MRGVRFLNNGLIPSFTIWAARRVEGCLHFPSPDTRQTFHQSRHTIKEASVVLARVYRLIELGVTFPPYVQCG